jgi:putative endonuclease
MYYVYYLQSKNNSGHNYVGYSENLKKRILEHNSRRVKSTKPYTPWMLIFYEAYLSKKDAKRREKYLKTTKGRKALKIMLKDTLLSNESEPTT